MKRSWLSLIFFLFILLSACSDQNEEGANSESIQKMNENISGGKVKDDFENQGLVPVAHSTVTNQEVEKTSFSYLDELPSDQFANYKLFVEDYKVRHLFSFTPEQIVLIYLHSVAIGDMEGIYALTYNGGILPDPDGYRKAYYEYLSRHDIDTLIKFRNYTSLQISEENRKENELVVVIEVEFSIHRHLTAWQLKKEDSIWKLNMYPYLQELKKNETK